jgi:hypothetical protein
MALQKQKSKRYAKQENNKTTAKKINVCMYQNNLTFPKMFYAGFLVSLFKVENPYSSLWTHRL